MIRFLNYSFSKSNKQKMNRIKEEQRVVEQMIRLYCRKKEGNKELCPECKELLQYATARLERCKFGENKPTCKKCPIHCYRPQMKERMCRVMRWAGPRMILHHPFAAIRHVMRELWKQGNRHEWRICTWIKKQNKGRSLWALRGMGFTGRASSAG